MSAKLCGGVDDSLSNVPMDHQHAFVTAPPSAPPFEDIEAGVASPHVVEPSTLQAFQGVASTMGDLSEDCTRESEIHGNPEDELDHCPICFESIDAQDAAMRCAGNGGVHHYFHAACLHQWIRTCSAHEATCPMCRGGLQFHGQRLNEYLQNESEGLNDEERSVLQRIADGLQGRNGWSDMDSIEKAAHVGGIAAAAGWGFMLGYSGSDVAERATLDLLRVADVPRQHWIAQGVGWIVGVLVRNIREAVRESREKQALQDRQCTENSRSRNCRNCR